MNEIVAFEALPFWRGVFRTRAAIDTMPFRLSVSALGFFTQEQPAGARKSIIDAYSSPDYKFITPPPGSSDWATALGQAKTDSLVATCGSLDGMRVLEVGSGNLTIAHQLCQRFQINGYVAIDPTLAGERSDSIRLVADLFPTLSIAGQHFDLVIGLSCLEHVEDPRRFLEAISGHLSPGGRAFLTFPDVGAMLHAGDLNAFVHEHMSYFDELGFRNLANAAGFDVAALSAKNGLFSALLSKSSDLRHRLENRRDEAASIRGAYDSVTHELGPLIRQRLGRGEKIGFHGACPGLNNFLWLTGIGDDPNFIVADGDRSKWGWYLPACSGAIRPPDDREYLSSDFIFIAASNFLDQIKPSLMAGGVRPERIAPLSTAALRR